MDDFIIADTGQIEQFLSEAKRIEISMKGENENINHAFSTLFSWEDPIKERVGELLADISKKQIEVFDYLELVYRNLAGFIDDLDVYLNSASRF